MMDYLVQVKAPHFTAGMVLGKTKIINAAPILRWTIGKTMKDLSRYFKRKHWEYEIIT